ncbi:hypothetical protein SAMN02745975_02389 [Geosporobacter subterraneus DSM 17957]|uniref:Uncharacterized protein n=1 Tax=Geosporobacter subterraneus DSM 17957 TaxID=1121919 RepID=A0A1M6KEQ8_9FIRM|nr:hypothetical protein SAMN02745975_02389 [Geosporobacter subterraneus DSM 17957]
MLFFVQNFKFHVKIKRIKRNIFLVSSNIDSIKAAMEKCFERVMECILQWDRKRKSEGCCGKM